MHDPVRRPNDKAPKAQTPESGNECRDDNLGFRRTAHLYNATIARYQPRPDDFQQKETRHMTAIQPTRISAVRGGVIAGHACLSSQGSHGQFVLDAATAGVPLGV